MKSTLTIQKFKRIDQSITLMDFSNINYLVGKNGSGKSSVLSAISFLADARDASNSRHFFKEDSIVEWRTEEGDVIKTNALLWNNENPNKVDASLDFGFRLLYIEEHPDKGVNGVGKATLEIGNPDKVSFQFLNETLNLLELTPIEAEKIVSDDPWDEDMGKRIFKEKGSVINPYMIATGVQAFLRFRYGIEQAARMSALDVNGDMGCVLILEEPENNMHPSLQKRIPLFLDNCLNSLPEEQRKKLRIFISTHSPFVIGAVGNHNSQKIYILDEGLLVDIQGNSVNESIGFSGTECSAVVGQMLGVEVTDLGYPENYCILEEASMQIILQHCKLKGILKDFQYVSASGESNVVKYADRMNDLWQLSTLITCNPFYQDKYFVVVDKTEKLNDKFAKLKSRLGDRFYELSNSSLELYYPNISGELFEQFVCEYDKNKGDFTLQGSTKREFAEKIAELIHTKEDFSVLFNSELDFLLK